MASASAKNDELFPLPLTGFERYLLADDSPAYPMTSWIEVRLRGEMDRAGFDGALDDALARHPLFTALVDRRGPGAQWVHGGGLRPTVDWGAADKPLECPHGEWIDITAEIGLRIWVRVGDETTRIVLEVQHCATDGMGVAEFMGDLLACYAVRTAAAGARRPVLAALEPKRLRGRGHYTVEPVAGVSRGQILRDTLREGFRWFSRRPAPLAKPRRAQGDHPAAADFPGMVWHALSEQQTRRLRQAAQRERASLNDLVLRDVFRAARDWNARHGGRTYGWLRVNVPTSLRERRHEGMPAGNAMSYAFLTRRPSDCDAPGALLEGIRWEMDAIKRWRLGLFFLGALGMLERVRGLMPLVVRLSARGCHATTVVTNLGDASRRFTARFPRENGRVIVGDLVLEELLGVPPVRRNTLAVFGMTVYAGRLAVALRCDRQSFSAADVRELLGLYLARLEESAGGYAAEAPQVQPELSSAG